MPDDNQVGTEPVTPAEAPEATSGKPAKKTAAKKAPAKRAATKKAATVTEPAAEPAAKKTAAKKAPAKKAAAKKTTAKRTTTKKAAAAPEPAQAEAPDAGAATAVLFQAPPAPTVTRRTRKTAAVPPAAEEPAAEAPAADEQPAKPAKKAAAKKASAKKSTAKKTTAGRTAKVEEAVEAAEATADEPDAEDSEHGEGNGDGPARRRRRRGGRRRRKPGDNNDEHADDGDASDEAEKSDEVETSEESGDGGEDGAEATSRRRRRRRRSGEDGGEGSDDPQNTVTRVRSRRAAEDEITAIAGSTRLEAKKQRRREGREAGRRRAPIVSEAEFLARREAVDRVMVVRQRDDLTQIGVLEDKVLVEHYVARASQTSLIGNVYLGRVQNVLPSMEAAFIDIGKGRNAVLYAGEVNWSALGHKDGQPRKIESVLSSGQSVLVQVTKDPIGHKGARLTSQVSLAGRFLVYVPDGTTSGISRKLPDTERSRLKALLKEIVPDTAGVIVRTAAEGASEDELTRDVERLKARWEDIEAKAKGSAPQLLYGEPDLTLKVVRDLFTEDFNRLVIQGDDAWDTVQSYVQHVAPDLEDRLERYHPGPNGNGGKADVFAEYRIEEQIAKGLDRKVWLPSGGSLIIDRTEAMTVVDVNTGKFTGSGGNLEETVTKNNLEAAEEMVRQLRLRDIGGIIVIDFIDMVLESNRDLVLRRLVECLGRDRTRHQVAEVTSLGLVQMTRKRIGTGLVESFSENCEHCQGRGVVIQDTPVEPKGGDDDRGRGGRRSRGRGRGQDDEGGQDSSRDPGKAKDTGRSKSAAKDSGKAPSPKDVAAMARAEEALVEDAPAVEAVTQAPQESAPQETLPIDAPADVPAEKTPEAPEAAEEPTEPSAAPQVVTRRRRSASRPAGQPAAETTEPQPAPEPVVVSVAAPAAEISVPEPPKIVTRTRGRSASRPAGPPAEATAEAEAEAAEAHPVEHVPVKKKGSRKR